MTTEIILTIVAIVVLIMMSGFFSGSETALTAASRARILRLLKEGDKRAQTVDDLHENKERLLGTILLGNNTVNIVATALATSVFTSLLGEYAVAAASLAMTTLVLIFAEVLPKTVAINNPDKTALTVAPVFRWLVPLLAPVTAAIRAIVRGTLRLFGVHVTDEGITNSAEEDLRGTIDLHTREGNMIKPHTDMLGGILDLDNTLVEQVMIHRSGMEVLDASQPVEAIVEQVVASPHTRIPLWRDDPDNIVAILHAKDVLRAIRKAEVEDEPLSLESFTIEPWFVPETTTLREQLNAFRARRSHFALVVDEYGALMGMVTLEDILEEIVGDISDEHDVTNLGIRPQADGRIIAEGDTPVRDLNREFMWSLPEDAATTLAGYIIHKAKIIPDPGQVFTFDGFKFEVLKKSRNRITLLRVTPPEDGHSS